MGVLDKIKNALFEVEYVEVEEPPKKEKKHKVKEEKPIAKKIVLPGKKEEKVEELHEEELRDEDFEIRPKDETLKEKREEFKFMDDNDFKVDEDDHYVTGEPEILQVIDEEKRENIPVEKVHSTREERMGRIEREIEEEKAQKEEDYTSYYQKPTVNPPVRESRPYGMDSSYSVPVHQYGTYEKYEEKTYFKPSPIISPIYGILDKNYRKEDVKEKKEVRITGFSRNNVSVDDIRNKAYGTRSSRLTPEVEEDTKYEVDEDDDNLLVDLSDRQKPEVKELTMGDAMEYFQDLGLEYNVDYVDVSKEKNVPKKKNEKDIIPKHKEENLEMDEKSQENDLINVIEENNNTNQGKKEVIEEDSDNLFDLIDSMYQESD